jgi:hypothetical protein
MGLDQFLREAIFILLYNVFVQPLQNLGKTYGQVEKPWFTIFSCYLTVWLEVFWSDKIV